MHTSFRVEGLREIQSAIRRAKDVELNKELREANKTVAKAVVSKALPNVPRQSGRLAGSVKALASATSASVKAGTPSQVPYAGVIHWGWDAHGITSRPFLTDAADSVEREVADDYAEALQRVYDTFSAR